MRFVESYNRCFSDGAVFLVFSTKDDARAFREMAGPIKYETIVCDQELGVSPITQKKYFGLQYIFANTAFRDVAVVDVDALFIKTIDYDATFSRKNDRKIIYANLSRRPLIVDVATHSSELFSPGERRRIDDIINMKDGTVRYFWFNDIPLYRKDLFLEFLRHVDYDHNIERLTYRNYDYVGYGYFLILSGRAELTTIDLILERGLLEDQDSVPHDVFTRHFIRMDPSWVKRDLDDAEAMDQVFMRLHVDRTAGVPFSCLSV
jgi:hypothetical protein